MAGLPDGSNKRSVQVKNSESLISHVRSKGINGNIFSLISYILYDADTEEKRKAALSKSKFWLCQKLNYVEYIDEFYKETSDMPVVTPKFNKWLTDIKRTRPGASNSSENQPIPINILDQFGVIPYKNWVDEGLTCSTQRYFGIGIDVKSDRITFPVHNKNGELIGVKARYCGLNKKIESDYKYLYLYPCNKSIEFFNFHRALPFIKEKKEAIVVEGGKTAMYLFQWNYKNCISIEGDSLSDYQIGMLKDLGIDVTLVFAFDKDKKADYVVKESNKIPGRKKYGIYDTENMLEDKDSPTDKGKAIWERLYTEFKFRLK